MSKLLPLRMSAVLFGALAGLIFVKEAGHLTSPLGLAGASWLFVGAALNVLICLGIALAASFALPSLFSKRWRVPAKDVFPLNVWGEPLNFIHFAATAFIAAGATGGAVALIKWGLRGAEAPLLFLIVGAGTMAGVRLTPYVFRGRVHDKTYN